MAPAAYSLEVVDSEQAVALIRRYFEIVHSNVEAVTDLYVPGCRLHYVGRHRLGGDYEGRDAIAELFRASRAAFRGTQRLQVHDVVSDGRHAVALLEASAELRGERVGWHRVVVFHVADGLIEEQWIHDSDQHLVEEVLA
jgi:hypothetical protein